MFLKKAITIVAIAAQLCFSLKLESVAPYEGQHSSKCMKETRLTGTLLNGKIYTFGGCFPIPYMVDPENDMNMFGGFGFNEKYNTTDTVYTYDITEDTWALETHTPVRMNSASLQIVKNDIYLFDVYADPDHYRSAMWKYATDTKEWHMLGELPFIWRYRLLSCERDGIIYFTGNSDGELRNIIHSYDTRDRTWGREKPFFLNQNLLLSTMLCKNDAFYLIGKKAHRDEEEIETWVSVSDDEEPRKHQYTLYTASYKDGGDTVDTGFNISVAYNAQQKTVSSGDDWMYVLDVFKKNTTISKINLLTQEKVDLGSFDQTLKNSLFLPYNHQVAYLFGGSHKRMFGRQNKPENKDVLKTYNHKIKLTKEDVLIQSTDEKQIVFEN